MTLTRAMKVLVKGVPASTGSVAGRARIIYPGDGQRLIRGEILVTHITDAFMFVEILSNAAAIVTDLGGVTSHPAIVARELGIPCVVATNTATKVVKTGINIFVDGNKGVIYEQD